MSTKFIAKVMFDEAPKHILLEQREFFKKIEKKRKFLQVKTKSVILRPQTKKAG